MTSFVLLIAIVRFENVVAKQTFVGGATVVISTVTSIFIFIDIRNDICIFWDSISCKKWDLIFCKINTYDNGKLLKGISTDKI